MFALSLHPEKTRLVEFGRFATRDRTRRGVGRPETFSFLGFTHISGKKRNGRFLLIRKSRPDRMRITLQAIKDQLRKRRHQSIPEQGRWLGQVVRGYFAYHAVPTNVSAIATFRNTVTRYWLKTLRRRSQKDRTSWEKMAHLEQQWLPPVRILHPWPEQRFHVTHSRREPSAGIPLARICAGGTR
jgi:RNA-directed DNA polymerase